MLNKIKARGRFSSQDHRTGEFSSSRQPLKHGNCKKFLLDSHLALTIVDIRSIQKKIESQLLLSQHGN